MGAAHGALTCSVQPPAARPAAGTPGKCRPVGASLVTLRLGLPRGTRRPGVGDAAGRCRAGGELIDGDLHSSGSALDFLAARSRRQGIAAGAPHDFRIFVCLRKQQQPAFSFPPSHLPRCFSTCLPHQLSVGAAPTTRPGSASPRLWPSLPHRWPAWTDSRRLPGGSCSSCRWRGWWTWTPPWTWAAAGCWPARSRCSAPTPCTPSPATAPWCPPSPRRAAGRPLPRSRSRWGRGGRAAAVGCLRAVGACGTAGQGRQRPKQPPSAPRAARRRTRTRWASCRALAAAGAAAAAGPTRAARAARSSRALRRPPPARAC